MRFEKGTLRTLVGSLILLALSLSCFWGASEAEASAHVRWAITLQHFASFILATLAIGLIFQFWQVRGIIEDMWEQAELTRSLRSSRLSRFTLNFMHDLPWDQLFKDNDRLSMMFAYANTWRSSYEATIREFLARGGELDVVLPDRESSVVIDGLCALFGQDKDEVEKNIVAAQAFFERLSGDPAKHRLRIYALSKPMTFTFYRFNTHVVLATYRHSSGKGEVVSLLGERGGALFVFVEKEWKWIVGAGVDEGFVRQLYPVAPPVHGQALREGPAQA